MPLARAWWRGSAWAVAATLVVPGVLAIAVATIALGGGLRSLGAVAQVVTGPDVPEARIAEPPAVTKPSSGARATPLPSVPSARAARVARVAPRTSAAPPAGGTTAKPSAPTGSRPVTRRPSTTTPTA